jgi:hypothetical protein
MMGDHLAKFLFVLRCLLEEGKEILSNARYGGVEPLPEHRCQEASWQRTS